MQRSFGKTDLCAQYTPLLTLLVKQNEFMLARLGGWILRNPVRKSQAAPLDQPSVDWDNVIASALREAIS